MQHIDCRSKTTQLAPGGVKRGLQVLNELLLLLEDVLELSKGGLHLLQRELVLALGGLVLGNPGVQLSDGVVKQGPFLQEDVNLLHPLVADGLDLSVPLPQSSNLAVSLVVCGHLLGGIGGGGEDLEVFQAGLLEGVHLLVESFDFVEVGGLGEAFGGGLLGSNQPGGELLDSGPVLGPELDVLHNGQNIAFNLDL